MKPIAFVLLTAALAMPAAAGTGSREGAKPKKVKLVCKRVERTASRMADRVCRTEAEWAGTSIDDDQDGLDVINNIAKTGCGGDMGGCSQGRGGPPRR